MYSYSSLRSPEDSMQTQVKARMQVESRKIMWQGPLLKYSNTNLNHPNKFDPQ